MRFAHAHRYVFAVGFANTKRYGTIALLPQTVPKAHYNLAKPIITLNSPQAIITGDLLYGRYAKVSFLLSSFPLFYAFIAFTSSIA